MYTQKSSFEHEDTDGNKEKELVLLGDKAFDWLQIWTAAPLLDVVDNKAIKRNFVFHANRLVFPNMVTYTK